MIPSEIKYLSKKIMESNEIPLLWGHFGVGKTDIAKEIAKETGKGLIILVISQMEPGDLIGMPSKSSNKTVFLKPDWWPENPNTIIMIDEINRAHRSIRNAIMQLLVDRRIHNHILPKDTWIMAAANPPDEEYDQVDLITDPAFMSRFFHLTLNANINDWTKWAKEEHVKPEVIDFINNYPEYISSDHIVSMKLDLRPSPRSWFKFSNVLKNLSEADIKRFGYSLGASILGADATNAFFNHLNNKKTLPTAHELLLEGKFFERLNTLNTEEKVSLILRINNYIEKLEENEMIQIIDNSEHKTIAKNLKIIANYIPKDSIFSVLRNLDNLIEKSTGVKKAFYDKLLEELSITLSEEKWLEEL